MEKVDSSMATQLAEAWRANRSDLVNLARRMLGDLGSAEDAVQETFARLARADLDHIEDQRGWLITVTSRICLDQVRSARVRRERSHELSTVERMASAVGWSNAALGVDPADRTTLDDEVRLALLVVLQRLSPAERVVLVLHDVFQLPYEAIATSVGRPAASCRQLARRARIKVDSENLRAVAEIDLEEQRSVAQHFVDACAGGDLAALVNLLDADVWGDVDLGPRDARTGRGAQGAEMVAKRLLHFFGGNHNVAVSSVGGQVVVRSSTEGGLYAVILLTIEDGVIERLHVLADPQILQFLDPAGPTPMR